MLSSPKVVVFGFSSSTSLDTTVAVTTARFAGATGDLGIKRYLKLSLLAWDPVKSLRAFEEGEEDAADEVELIVLKDDWIELRHEVPLLERVQMAEVRGTNIYRNS